MNYHLAIDIGASSGRHMLGYIENGKLRLEEIYRFENHITKQNDALVWDIQHLLNEVVFGIAECKKTGRIPNTVAIDTWGVDYVLLDENMDEIMPAYSYRDNRTNEVQSEVENLITQNELYSITGIQKQNFNTVYQLYCDKLSGKLEKARYFLMIPDYLSYKLTGVLGNEYTNATTTGLVNANLKTWDTKILKKLGLPENIFSKLSVPGTYIGGFTEEIKHRVGFDCAVVYCPSHDTASAVAACPANGLSVYISSGTWSLIGTENKEPVLTNASRDANFTNEGGIVYRFRFLKNIMGMWLFQSIRRDLNKELSYDDMMHLAMENNFREKIDPNDPLFTAPENMIQAVKTYLKDENLSLESVLSSVYHSLAHSYANAVKEIETISGKTVETINIVGGGSRDKYLNFLTKQYTGKRVLAGPVEATATGNIISQLMYTDKKLTLDKARELVKKSFDIQEVD